VGVARPAEGDEEGGGQQQQRVDLPKGMLPLIVRAEESDAPDRDRQGQGLPVALDPEDVGARQSEGPLSD
jgi:hypothetical protein